MSTAQRAPRLKESLIRVEGETHTGWVDHNVVDDICVGDLVDIDDDLVDVDVIDGNKLLDDCLLDESGCID